MALNKQPIAINLGLGLDTKTDPKHVIPGKLLTLENCTFEKNVRLNKKKGNVRFPQMTIGGDPLTSGDSLSIFNDELLQYQNQNLLSYSPGASSWIDKGGVVSAIVSTQQIIKNTAQQTQCDSASSGGVSVYAWEDSRGGVRCSVYDEETGTPMLVDTVVDGSGSRVRCLGFKSYLFIFYYKSGSLYCRRVNPISPTLLDTAVVISNTVNTANPTYDVYAYTNLRMMFVHNVEGSTDIKLGWVSDAPATLGGALTPLLIAEEATNCLGIIPGPSNTFYIAYQNSSDGVRCTIRNNGGGQVVAPFTVENIVADDVVNITGHIQSDTSVRLYYEVVGTADDTQYVRRNDVTSAGSAGTPADFMRSVGLYTKGFNYTDDGGTRYGYVGVVHESILQSTYFTVRSDGVVAAKQQPTLAGGLTTRPILQNVWVADTAIFQWALLNKTQIVSENATIFTPLGVSKTSLDFTASDIFTAAQLGSNLHIVGGILTMYDGQSVVEHGFHLYPEGGTFSPQTSGGNLADGDYQACFVYEWTDNQGQIHQSAPSVPELFTISGGSGSGSVDVTAPTLRITAKKSPRTNVSIVGYVTEPAGSVFYRWTSVASPTLNNPAVDTVTMPDITVVTISNQILYTTGGVLENIAAPACSVIEVFKNRVWLGGLEDGSIWYSKENKVGLPVEFSDQLLKKVEAPGGRLTSFGVLDDKLLYLKRDRYYFTFGDGPNNTGQGGDFAEAQFVTADAGCESAASMTRVPGGLMFKSAKGIYMIDSTLNPSYVGADVEAFNDRTFTSGVLVADTNQVRFTTLEGPTLFYDYYQKQWGVFSKVAAKDAIIWQNQYVFLRTSGVALRETAETYKDDGAPIRMRIGTGWLALASVIGYQRVYQLCILGEYKSPHKLKVSIAYDYSESYSQVAYFDPEEVLEINTYGSQSPYGKAGTVYGGKNSSYRFIVNLKVQKCQAIRFLIEEETTSATIGTQEAFTITSVGVLAGVKVGIGKFGRNQAIAARS